MTASSQPPRSEHMHSRPCLLAVRRLRSVCAELRLVGCACRQAAELGQPGRCGVRLARGSGQRLERATLRCGVCRRAHFRPRLPPRPAEPVRRLRRRPQQINALLRPEVRPWDHSPTGTAMPSLQAHLRRLRLRSPLWALHRNRPHPASATRFQLNGGEDRYATAVLLESSAPTVSADPDNPSYVQH
jgi:hypothetical protein